MIKRFAVLGSIYCGCLAWLYARTIGQTSLAWSLWGYSDWLINYQGGFIRRGLPGEIIHRMAAGHPVLPFVNLFIFGIGASVLLLWTLLLFIQTRIPLPAAVVSFLMPGSIVHALAINQFFYRKEVVFAVPLLIAALGVVVWRKLELKSAGVLWCFFALSSILGAGATLFHETFFLAGLPALYFLWSRTGRRRLALFLLLPTAVAFAFSCVHSGSPQVSEKIWNSLNESDRQLILSQHSAPRAPFFAARPRKALSTLTSNTQAEILWVAISFFESSVGLWLLILGSAVLCLIAWMKLCRSGPDFPARSLWWVALCLFIFEAPIYLFSEDWGRWICWFVSSVLIIWTAFLSLPDDRPPTRPRFLLRLAERFGDFGLNWNFKTVLAGLVLWNLFFSIPEYGFADRIKQNIFRCAFFSLVDESHFVKFVNGIENVDNP